MGGSAFSKNIVRSITGSMGRFLAIMGIVALGCGFFAGLQMCGPDMRVAADKLYDGTNLYDLRLVSTMGFTRSDVDRLAVVEGVQSVMPAMSMDAMTRMGNLQIATRISSMDVDAVEKGVEQDANVILSDDGTYINRVFLREGSWPSKSDECVISADKLIEGLSIGDSVEVLYGVVDIDDALSAKTFKVVGTVSASQYPYTGRFGTTTLGSGSIDEYIFVRKDAFVEDYPFTEMYMRVEGADAYESGSDAYKAAVNAVRERIESMQHDLAQARLVDMRADAQEKIDEAREKLESKKADANKELGDAQSELDDAKKELDSSKTQLDDAQAQLNDAQSELSDAQAQLADGQAELDASAKMLADGEKAYEDGASELASSGRQLADAKQTLDASEAQVVAGREALNQGERQWEEHKADLLGQLGLDSSASLADARAYVSSKQVEIESGGQQLEDGIAQAEGAIAQLEDGIGQLEDGIAQVNRMLTYLPGGSLRNRLLAQRAELDDQLEQARAGLQIATASRRQLEEQLAALPEQAALLEQALAGIDELESARVTLDDTATQLADAEAKMQEGKAAYESGLAQYNDGAGRLESSRKELEDGRSALESGRAELADGRRDYESGLRDYEDGRREYEDGRKQYEDGQSQYNQGLTEYETSKADAERRIAEAESELDDAQKEVDKLEAPKLYLLDRTQNEGIVSHNSDSQRMDSIADVFPFIFFLVAALVALTTMTRMVDDCRVEIGTFKALGYSKMRIASKFLWYAGIASTTGAVLGIAILSQVLPIIVTSAYSVIYTVPVQIALLPINPGTAFLSGGLGVGVTLFATYAAVFASLKETPATIMLPRAPSAGKRILLERVGFIWRNLSFSWKVTCRNMFRYKKRLTMTVVGIAGCAALLLVGFGLHDAIWDVFEIQYGPLQHYDTTVGLNSDALETDIAEVEDYLRSTNETSDIMRVQVENMQVGASQSDRNPAVTRVFVPQNSDELAKAVTLRDRVSQDAVAFDDNAVVVSEKLATTYGLKPGDEILIYEQDNIGNTKGDGIPLTITGITENYVFNLVYVGKEAWKGVKSRKPSYSTILCSTNPSKDVRAAISDRLHNFGNVSVVTYTDDIIDAYRKTVSVVDMIVVVLIVSAGLLAFIVLYNLTNINISERVREIASLKVLGFTKHEIYAYIFREIALLSILGDLVGMVFGVFLAHFVVVTAEVDQVMFGRTIHPMSFVYAFALTLVFTALILLLMRHKLDKVDMVESLKSVE